MKRTATERHPPHSCFRHPKSLDVVHIVHEAMAAFCTVVYARSGFCATLARSMRQWFYILSCCALLATAACGATTIRGGFVSGSTIRSFTAMNMTGCMLVLPRSSIAPFTEMAVRVSACSVLLHLRTAWSPVTEVTELHQTALWVIRRLCSRTASFGVIGQVLCLRRIHPSPSEAIRSIRTASVLTLCPALGTRISPCEQPHPPLTLARMDWWHATSTSPACRAMLMPRQYRTGAKGLHLS